MKPLSLVVCAIVLAGCTTGHAGRSASSAAAPTTLRTTASSLPLGGPHCQPPSPISRGVWPEVQGTSDQIQMRGLIMVAGPDGPLRVHEQVKIVWRITGSGDLQLSYTDPRGRPHPLWFGPDAHGGSTYVRPGDEWGAGYVFTEPGCWRLHAQRGTATANVWLRIAA